MKKIFLYTIGLAIGGMLFSSCDKVTNPYVVDDYEIDTTLYPGNWQDYLDNEYPVFTTNTNTNVNVLIEDFTGHTCFNCPTAADVAHNIHETYPNRVFIASIHASPGGMGAFQASDPNGDKYTTDHTNPEGLAYGEEFASGFNFLGNPQGAVNRKTVDGKMFDFSGTWESRASNIMTDNNLLVNIQSVFNYYPETEGGYLHVEVEKKTDDAISMNTVVYVIQDSLVDWQKMPDNTDNEFYVHRDKHLGSIDHKPWGSPTFTDEANGTKVIFDYSYALPENITADNLHFLIYVYNVDTYEILQVIKQEVE